MRIEDASSLSYIAEQHRLHKERQERIKKAALKELTKASTVITIEAPAPKTAKDPIITYIEQAQQYVTVYDVVMSCVCKHFAVRKSDIISSRRIGSIVKARHAAVIMLFKFTNWTTFKIADKLKRDPSTIFYIIKKQQAEPIDFEALEADIRDTIPQITPITKVTA